MKRHHYLLAVALALGLVLPASAGLFFKHDKEKPTPAQRVPELLETLKNDPSDKKRESAAEELRQYEPKDFPEIVPALIQALLRDPKPEVRGEAAQTLGKLRPVTQEVGQALEQAMANDTSHRVRWHTRMILWSYQRNGYKSPNKIDGPSLTPPPGTATTNEPPLAAPDGPPTLPPPTPVPPPPLAAKPAPVSSSILRPVLKPVPLEQGPALTPP